MLTLLEMFVMRVFVYIVELYDIHIFRSELQALSSNTSVILDS